MITKQEIVDDIKELIQKYEKDSPATNTVLCILNSFLASLYADIEGELANWLMPFVKEERTRLMFERKHKKGGSQ